MFVFTAFVGLRCQAQLNRNTAPNEPRQVLTRFKSFQRIVKILALVTFVDIAAAVLRIVSRWYVLPDIVDSVQFVRFLGLVVECWVYGLSHSNMRAAVSDFFGCMKSAVCVPPTPNNDEAGDT